MCFGNTTNLGTRKVGFKENEDFMTIGCPSMYMKGPDLKIQKKNIFFTFGILSAFCIVAYIVNISIDYNYMFLMRGDGTPYDIFFNLVNGNPVLYPLLVVFLFLLYITGYYFVYYFIQKRRKANRT